MIQPRRLILVKHAMPVLDANCPPHEWRLSDQGREHAKKAALGMMAARPVAVFSSPEPKALDTAQIFAESLGRAATVIEGLRELRRPALPIVSADARHRLNEAVFLHPDSPQPGFEAASLARERFIEAVAHALRQAEKAADVLCVTHGTVMALFTARFNADVDAFQFWKTLDCLSVVELAVPGFKIAVAGRAADFSAD